MFCPSTCENRAKTLRLTFWHDTYLYKWQMCKDTSPHLCQCYLCHDQVLKEV